MSAPESKYRSLQNGESGHFQGRLRDLNQDLSLQMKISSSIPIWLSILILLCQGWKAVAQPSDLIPSINNETVTYIGEDYEGNLVCGTLRGLFRYNGNAIHPFISDKNIFSVICEDDGTVWAFTEKGLEKHGPGGGTDASLPFNFHRYLLFCFHFFFVLTR